jgi:glycosyltransferase involved in cell wall biosynthesis
MNEKDQRRLLWHSNAPHAGTGYAQQTNLFGALLAKDPSYDFGISAFFGIEGAPIRWHDAPVYPGIGQTHGNETIAEHARVHFEGDLRGGAVLTLMDVWVLDPTVWRQLNVASWVPIDHEPLPPAIGGFFQDSTAVPIAMSKFGRTQLENAGFDPLYVPHAIDTEIYRPHPKAEAREQLKVPEDAFIVGMVAANKGNPSRKCFGEALQAFKMLRDKHDDAILYLHTEMSGRMGGVPLPDLIDAVGIPREAVTFCDQYRAVHYPYAPERMAAIYSTFDVLLMPSAGEGFGIPAIEAQACGVPVIASDFSAQPELNASGWLVSGQRVFTPLRAWQFQPDIGDIADALRQAYDANTEHLGRHAREFVVENYSLGDVYEKQMLPALDAAYERFEAREPKAVPSKFTEAPSEPEPVAEPSFHSQPEGR